jgi:hypothetical protein
MKLLTISELAKKLSLHPDTIRKYELLGYVTSIRTIGGHRRYVESEVERLQHQMKFPRRESILSEAMDTWFRKDRFIYWKRFVELNALNPEVANKPDEICHRQGAEMALQALSKLNDEDWASFDKIDEVLKPVCDWYRKNHEYHCESILYATCEVLKNGTHQAIKDGKNVTSEAVETSEKHYRRMLEKLGMKEATQAKLNAIAYQLDGIRHVLWGSTGIAPHGEKSVLEGNGSFPHEREQLKLDLTNGWDGKTDRYLWRQRKMEEHFAERHESS